MASSMPLTAKHCLFQVNHHVQASIMLLSIMDSAELDLNNTLLPSSSSSSSSSTISTSNPDDYDKDLRLAAELGRYLLERNQELQNYIHVLQKQLDDQQSDMKLLHSKYLSTREQLDGKCKQMEVLDTTNFDLEQDVALLRRENEKNRQQIKELFNLCDKTRRQCQEIEHDYETFRTKQFSSYFLPKQSHSPCSTPIFSTPVSTKRQRSNSFTIKSNIDGSPSLISRNLFDLSSTSIFQSHLSELKSRIHSLTNECTILNDQLHRSEQEKHYFIDRITQLERQRRDENDSLQTELNYYRKLVEKSNNDMTKTILTNIYSPPEHDLSLYDEVLLQTKPIKSSYELTNYKQLFASVYEKLKSK